MSRRIRTLLFLVSAAAFLGLYLLGLSGLPPSGHYPGPYGDTVNALAQPERHVTNVVTAVNFDFRAMDTLGEELILFTSVMGVSMILRRLLKEKKLGQEHSPPGKKNPPSDADSGLTLPLVGMLTVFGIYVITHGQLTPGGGFQGGVLLATVPLLVFLGRRIR